MPIGGIKTSLTIDLTILPNAAPMMIPIAISSTLPFMANSLNSFSIEPPLEKVMTPVASPDYQTNTAQRAETDCLSQPPQALSSVNSAFYSYRGYSRRSRERAYRNF